MDTPNPSPINSVSSETSAPVSSVASAPSPKRGRAKWLVPAVVVIAIGAYAAYAGTSGMWPFEKASTDIVYQNTQEGYELTLPASWKGYRAETDGGSVYFSLPTADDTYGSLPDGESGFADMFVIVRGLVSDAPTEDNPFLGSGQLLGTRGDVAYRLLQTQVETPADALFGLDDIKGITASFRLTVPAPSVTTDPTATSDPTAEWTDFSSKYFTLSFRIPPGFEVRDAQSSVRIAQAPYTTRDIGDDNAFFVLIRYEQGDSMAERKAAYIGQNASYAESTMVIDGTSFPVVSGRDPGRFEGDSAGSFFAVFLEQSFIEVIQRPANSDVNFDPLSIARQILLTFKFTK